MNITTETTEGAAVVRFAGAADISAVEAIRRALEESMQNADNRVVCDLSGMDFICSDALGVFISAHEGAREAGGYMRLLQPQERIRDILATTQLNRLFDVYDSLDTALRS